MDLTKLEKRKDYNGFSDIDRIDAWDDFKHWFPRFGWSVYNTFHVFKDQCTNIVRLAGVSGRDKSQKIGTVLFAAIMMACLAVAVDVIAN